jgi:hypothetical protein
MKRFLLLTAFFLPAFASGAELVFTGVMGQSQIDAPIFAVGFGGVAATGDGRAWALGDSQLFEILSPTEPQKSRLAPSLPLPPLRGTLRSDGENLWVFTQDLQLLEITSAAANAVITPRGKFPSFAGDYRDWTLAPKSLTAGFAKTHRFFALADNVVYGANFGDETATPVLTLPPALKDWRYIAVALLPPTGDLLVASGYPDMQVRRYGADGAEITAQGWSRRMFAESIVEHQGRLFAMVAGGKINELPFEGDAEITDAGAPDSHRLSGFIPAGPDGWWCASTQGLFWLSADARKTRRRLGGLPAIALAATPAGRVLAAVKDYTTRVVMLWADAEADESLTGTGDEKWMPASQWSREIAGLAWDGQRYFTVAAANGQAWRFAPENAVWPRHPWTPASAPESFAKPRAVGAADGIGWVLTDKELFRLDLAEAGDEPAEAELIGSDLTSVKNLAGLSDGVLLVSSEEITRLRNGEIVWTLTGLAGAEYVAVAPDAPVAPVAPAAGGFGVAVTRDGAEVTLFNLADGKLLATFAASTISPETRFGAVALAQDAVFVADLARAAVLRLAIE